MLTFRRIVFGVCRQNSMLRLRLFNNGWGEWPFNVTHGSIQCLRQLLYRVPQIWRFRRGPGEFPD